MALYEKSSVHITPITPSPPLPSPCQVLRLDHPLSFPNDTALWGCFSWVDVPAAGKEREGVAVLDDDVFAERQACLRRALEDVAVVQLDLDA